MKTCQVLGAGELGMLLAGQEGTGTDAVVESGPALGGESSPVEDVDELGFRCQGRGSWDTVA